MLSSEGATSNDDSQRGRRRAINSAISASHAVVAASANRLVHDGGGSSHRTSGSLLFGREMAQKVLPLAAERAMRELYIDTRVSRSWSIVDRGFPVVLHVW